MAKYNPYKWTYKPYEKRVIIGFFCSPPENLETRDICFVPRGGGGLERQKLALQCAKVEGEDKSQVPSWLINGGWSYPLS